MNGHKRINSSLSSALTTPNAPTSLTAQESREKRLAHQQSRYRDRGGVFVPQQRTALLDILLGKTTLKRVTRSRSRSVSCSPVRRKSEKLAGGNHDQAPPKGKKGRKSVIQDTGDQDEQNAGPSIIKKSAPLRKGGRKSSSSTAKVLNHLINFILIL
ncbi:hypothetical protein GYMLUDRAFT_39456 [Collybiopsis luxurians FD-317 M1]|nr:hypothetical protein GYMLUDRAFT_39456 [Collybiopsis luxurians FD-317 M1]